MTQDFGSIHFDNDRMLMTLAFVPEGTEIPKPPSVGQLDQLTDVPTQAGRDDDPAGRAGRSARDDRDG